MTKTVQEQLEDFVKEMKCYHCGEPCDRLITFATLHGIIQDYECLKCRRERVEEQVALGLRPASDLDNPPEQRKL